MTEEELAIIEQAKLLIKKKERIDEENKKTEFEKGKLKAYNIKINKIKDKIANVEKKRDDIEIYVKEFRRNFLKECGTEIYKLNKELEEIGEYDGSCHHIFSIENNIYGDEDECKVCGYVIYNWCR